MKKTILINISLILSFFVIFEFLLIALDKSSLRGMSEAYFEDNKNVEGKAFGKKFYTDKFGFRVPNKNYSYSKNKSIILVGDSFVFGPGVEEPQTFSGKLRNYKNDFNIFNSSKPGNQMNDYLTSIKYFIDNYENNEFIIFINFDDLNFSKKNKINNNEKDNLFTNFRNIELINKINDLLRSKFYSYVWLVGMTTDPAKRYYDNILNNFKKKNAQDEFDKKIFEINNLLKKNNINGIFIIIPYSYQMRDKCKKTDFFPQKKIKELFEKNKVDFFDFTEIFCKKNNGKNLFINSDPAHLSSFGHEIVFRSIKDF